MNYPQVPDRRGATAGGGLLRGLSLGVVALGLLNFLLGFAPYADLDFSGNFDGGLPDGELSFNFFSNTASGAGVAGLALLLAAGLIAGFGLLPNTSGNEPVVAGLSTAGFASLLFVMLGLDDGYDVGIGLVLVLVASFVQAALAVATALVAAGVIKPPAPKPYGYGPPPGPGWQQQQQPTQFQQSQPPQYGPPPGGQPPYGAPGPWRQ